MTPPCPSKADLHALVNGSFPDSEADELQLHLEQCEACQVTLQGLVADGDFWQSVAEKLLDREVAGPELNRVVDELRQQSPEDAENMGEAIELKLSFIEAPTEPGTIGRLKHYDILRVAGRGGMGIVLKAFDRTLRRVVAVKMLAPHLAGNGQARQRFVREGRSAAGICHEHVVTIHAVEESPPFIVMQYVKGETLESRIHRNGSLDVREAVRIAKQIAQGLAAAHAQGVVHRDIKPANILLENGVARVRITDFGLARAVDDASLTQSGVVAGTPQYMAPEQANGDAVDERADLFSLGSVLYTMLAGHAPFRATTTMGVLKRLCDHSARPIREINPDVPDWLVVLINRLHAKRPADRYQSAQEVANVLERGLAAMQNSAAPTVQLDISGEPDHGVAAPVDELLGDSAVPVAVASSGSADRTDPPELRWGVPAWMFQPLALWVVFFVVGLCVAPFAPTAMIVAALLAVAWFVGQRFSSARTKSSSQEQVAGHCRNDAVTDLRFENFFLVRLIRRGLDVAPPSLRGGIGWLMLWLLPAGVWSVVFWIQEERVRLERLPRRVDQIDIEIVLAALALCASWVLIGFLWFRRRRGDGSRIFAPESRRKGLLGTLGLAAIFAACGYDTWKSDVYQRAVRSKIVISVPEGPAVVSESSSVESTMLRVHFEKPHSRLEVEVDFQNQTGRFSPSHHGVVLSLAEPPGTYDWRALLNGRQVSSGEVTLVNGQLAELKVPRPALSQLISGRWESASDQEGAIEMEFDDGRAIIAVRSSERVSQSRFVVRLDESVTPPLIDLSSADGQQLMGILKFQSGRIAGFGMSEEFGMMSGMSDSFGMASMESDMDGGGEYGYDASPGGMPGMDAGYPGMASSTESDRLLICMTEGSGLRPWEFKADEGRRHILFSLIRSRESESLRENLAFEPIERETTPELISESVQAWSKRLKIETEGKNSVGMEMVLVPPSTYYLINRPELVRLRRQLPEPVAEKETTEQPVGPEPPFDYHRNTCVSYPFVMSRNPVSVAQFKQFIDDSGYVTDAERGSVVQLVAASNATSPGSTDVNQSAEESSPSTLPEARTIGGWGRSDDRFEWIDGWSWESSIATNPDLEHAVSVISWHDATEFCKWLTEKEGRQYRLPTIEEWTAAMQLGAGWKPLSGVRINDPFLQDYQGWYDAKSLNPLDIARTLNTYAEWTQDAQINSPSGQMVLVHHEVSDDGVRFYSGIQFYADKAFRASSVGFRVVAEPQVLAAQQSVPAGETLPGDPPSEATN